mmetsp:Transcript_26515/g.74189  ORF Transcript_26515/g.74189 Transcript_26515/m.74189 type:complete len:294 (-) Transcript_26515:284-1165(-)
MDLSVLEVVVLVQEPSGWVSWQGALVHDGLTVVLAVRLQWQLPETVGGRVELQGLASRLGNATLDLGVLDGDGGILHQTRIRESDLARQVLKVVPVQRSAQALAPEHLVLLEVHGHAAVGIHVRKVQLATRLQQAEALLQHGFLVGAEVDDAVGDDDVEGFRLELEVLQLLEVSLLELDVGESELFGVVLLVLAGDVQLLVGHVDADDLAGGTDQLGGDVHVATGTASQIQDGGTLHVVLRQAQSASVVLGDDLRVDFLDGIADILRRGTGRAARVRLQVIRRLQFLAVVVGD